MVGCWIHRFVDLKVCCLIIKVLGPQVGLGVELLGELILAAKL